MAKTPTYLHRVTGIYENRQQAEGVFEQLVRYGFRRDQLEIIDGGVHAEQKPGIKPDSDEVRNEVIIDGAIGTAVGAGLGVLGEAALAAANISLFVASPIIGTLTMMGWGAALGGIMGAAAGAGNRDTQNFSDLIRAAADSGHAVLIAYAGTEEQTTAAQAVIGNSLKTPGELHRIDAIE